jgi:hypothetical protein
MIVACPTATPFKWAGQYFAAYAKKESFPVPCNNHFSGFKFRKQEKGNANISKQMAGTSQRAAADVREPVVMPKQNHPNREAKCQSSPLQLESFLYILYFRIIDRWTMPNPRLTRGGGHS